MSVDPDARAALIAKGRLRGWSPAGWTTGLVEMDRPSAFAAAD